MPMYSLETCLEWPWNPRAERLPEGDWRIVVDGLNDFEVFAETFDEAWSHFPGMLRTHLTAYLEAGDDVPYPCPTFTLPAAESTGGQGASTVNWNPTDTRRAA